MTDEAEQNAEKYCLLALESNPESPVALALLASIRLSQTQNDDAISLLEQSLSKWQGKDVIPPSYPDRLHLVRLLLEVDMYEKAMEVLESLQREDEDDVELWYYYTIAYYSQNDQDSWSENWKNARECGENCLRLYEKLDWDDEDLKNGCVEMLEEIKKSGISNDMEKDDEEEEDDHNEWVDSESDVDMEDVN